MTLSEYQKQAMQTCMPSCDNFSYMFLNLVGEVGELASKVAKAIRREEMAIGEGMHPNHTNQLEHTGNLPFDEANKFDEDLMLEAGDILWQLNGLATVMGWSMEDVAQSNLDKLASRQKRGVIAGSGDHR